MKNILFILAVVIGMTVAKQPYYINQCSRDDPEVNDCLKNSINQLSMFIRDGIPELDSIGSEPAIIDEISVAIGSGPDGYRAIFRDINAFGVSNMTVINLRSDIDTLQFQLTYDIPRIKADAKYISAGVLLLIKASGGGDYWGEYEGVKAKVYLKLSSHPGEDDLTYLEVDQIKMDFSVRDIKMGVKNLKNGNSIIEAALNLFINTNAQELLKEMKPAVKSKLSVLMRNSMNRLFAKIPLEQWLD